MRIVNWVFLSSLAASAAATEYVFQDFFVLKHADGTTWSATELEVRLGKFAAGYTPVLDDYSNWGSHFITQTAGYYVGPSNGGPEFSATLTLGDNATFAVNDQLFVLVQTPSGYAGAKETALFTDSSWRIITNSPTAVVTNYYQFTGGSTATFGSVDFASSTSATTLVPSIPEPSSFGVFAGALALGSAFYRSQRRRLKRK